MSDADESIKKELIKAGVDLAKLVYDDAIQPLARETGQALGTVGKTVNVALAPLRGLVWSWDQIEVFVTRKITEKLEQRNVPPARIRPPNPDIAIPAIEALRYSQLRDNYAALLATSMDAETASQAHPAFVEILKQLTKDEALILEYLPEVGRHEPLVDLGYVDTDSGSYLVVRHLGTIGTDANCSASTHIPTLVDNLCRLGLTECPPDIGLFEDWRYDRIRGLSVIAEVKNSVPASRQFFEQKKMIGLTELGSAFRKACVS